MIDCIRGRFDRKVEYIGFSIPDEKDSTNSTKPSLAMTSKADIVKTLGSKDIMQFRLNLPDGPQVTKKL